jgi:hypothetical protein
VRAAALRASLDAARASLDRAMQERLRGPFLDYYYFPCVCMYVGLAIPASARIETEFFFFFFTLILHNFYFLFFIP